MQYRESEKSSHYVFIADNEGMNLLFPVILDFLKREEGHRNHLSILYFSEDESFIFREELEILTIRFRDNMICYFKDKPHKEFIETILVTNTKAYVEFQIAINAQWHDLITEHLIFLGVDFNDLHFLLTDKIH